MHPTAFAILAILSAASAAEITGFYAADAVTDETLKELQTGDILNLGDLGTNRITVYALASDDTKGVIMKLNGQTTRKETESPYALFGDNPAYAFPDDAYLGVGRYSVRAIPYGESYFRDRGDAVTVSFRIVPGDLECNFDVNVESCDLEAIEEALEEDDNDCNIAAAALKVEQACSMARFNADQGTPLADLIDEFDEQDVMNYFDGGTHWNENTGYVRGEEGDAPIIGEIYENVAQSATIGYPGRRADLNDNLNLAECKYGAVMCTWIRDRQPRDNNGNCGTPLDRNCVDADPADNTDLCYVDASRSPASAHVPEGVAFFPDEAEGDVHAHGFAFRDGSQSTRFKGNLLFYISMYDHLSQRGYVENVPMAPMCACLEHMPTVSRADCTEVDVDEVFNVKMSGDLSTLTAERTEVDIDFNACDGDTANDLYSELVQLYGDDLPEEVRSKHLVGPEDNDEPSNCPTE